ncbi:hypothetical protein IJG76_00120 [Candidatus Saccharibacteria bacterium]|nr:hypothetical protein [Candidatus Saccharibacteria bacterium]
MKIVQANLDICKCLAEGKAVHGRTVTKDLLLIFPEPGHYGYFFKKKDIAFAIEKVEMNQKSTIDLSIIDPRNELRPTFTLFLTGKQCTSRVFTTKDDKKISINVKYLRNIDLNICDFYQNRANRLAPIIAVERKTPVMLLMPIIPLATSEEDGLPKTYITDEFTDN